MRGRDVNQMRGSTIISKKIPEKELWCGYSVRNNGPALQRKYSTWYIYFLSLPVGKLCQAYAQALVCIFQHISFKAQAGTYLLRFYSLLQEATAFPLICLDNKTVGGN